MEEKQIDFGHGINKNKFTRNTRYDLYNRLEKLADYRKPQGKQYKYADLLFIVVAASLFGYCDEFMVVEWCAINAQLIASMTTLDKIPSYKTIERVYVFTDYEELAKCLTEWLEAHFGNFVAVNDHGHIQVKLDGKADRGAAVKSNGENPRYNLNHAIDGRAIDPNIMGIASKKKRMRKHA